MKSGTGPNMSIPRVFHGMSKNLPQISAAVPAMALLFNEPKGRKNGGEIDGMNYPLVGVLENSPQAALGGRPTEPLAIEK